MFTVKESLKDRVALVSGAGSGIGKAAAKMLAYTGARIAVLDRDRDDLHQTAQDIRAQHGSDQVIELVADIAVPEAVAKAFQTIDQTWERLDIVVASAGINGTWAPIEKLEIEDWDKTLDTNLGGTFLTLKHAAPRMKIHGGSIVVISSINGTRIFGNCGATAYACSKAAQIALVKMLAVELGPSRIRINAICPGSIETPIHQTTQTHHLESIRIPIHYPNGKIPLTPHLAGTAGQVAELIWFLASDFSSHVTGTEIYIDGAESILQG